MKICPKCNINHDKLGKFCSRSCANSRGPRSELTKSKQSISNKIYEESLTDEQKVTRYYQWRSASPNFICGPYTKIKLRPCSHCGKEFWSNNLHTKVYNTTCSDHCFLSVKRKNSSGNKTTYNGEVYDSNWEVLFAKWMNEQSITFIRPTTHIAWIDSAGKQRKYFPDFYIPILDLYIDPKNRFCIVSQKEKLDYVSKNINLIYGEVEYLKNHVLSLLE